MIRLGTTLRSFADYSAGRENNFNLLRLGAAMMVLISHSYALATGQTVLEPLRWLPGFSLGALAVDVFFVASGFLVTGSLLQRRSLLEFCAARALRIFPGLWVALLLSIVVIGVWFTSLNPTTFFSDWQTWRYLLKNAILIHGVSYDLPGAFIDVPYAGAVNGSLWTLPQELLMYGWLAAAWAVVRLLRIGPDTSLRVFCCVVALVAVVADAAGSATHQPSAFIGLLARFFSGTALRVLQERVPASKALFAVLLSAILLSTLYPPAFGLIYPVAIGYVVIYLALVPSGPIRVMAHGSDYSYGIYIYAFPVQQAIASLWRGISPVEMMACSCVVTLAFAAASWHLVERRALRFKNMFNAPRP